MHCTSCKTGELIPSKIEANFKAHTCNNCNGHWIHLDDYFGWQKKQTPMQAVVDDINVEVDTIDADETKQAMLCPESSAIMTKFHIFSDIEHKLDWSEKGIWLDKGEWELLKEKGVADKLNQIFTDEYQKNIREEKARNTFEQKYLKQFGEENYSRLKFVRSWLHDQTDEDRTMMMAFLLTADPYSANK